MSEDRMPMANIPPFGLRMRPDLKTKIEEAARANNRSLNAEIVSRLYDSLDLDALRMAYTDSELVRDTQGLLLESMSRENEALRKAGLISEQLVIEFAHAISKAAEGEPDELQKLVEREKSQPTLKRLVTVWSIVREN